MAGIKVWRNDKSGDLYHDSCFEEGESRDGFTVVDKPLDELEDTDACESCGGVFLSGFLPSDDDDDTDDDNGNDK